MSVLEKDYFPPSGSRYQWQPPALTNRPWWYRYDFKYPDRRSCTLQVDHSDKGYQGAVIFYNMRGVRQVRVTRTYKRPLTAMLAAESLGDALIKTEKLPKWTLEALALGWRPPQ